ncbi:MAG: 2-amino-4-hydroxy-6-hydroxymethyldihydropteridine diphosphokinase, partial [Thalassolituus sp.]
MARVFLGVGANLNPEQNIVNGIRRLSDDVAIVAISPAYLSPAVGFDGPDFINLVVQISTAARVVEL